jgi:hypothetical protein
MTPMRRLHRSLVALAFSLASSVPAASAQIDLSSLIATPNPRLGIAFPGSRPELYRLIADAGIGMARISVAWSRVEPDRGRFAWAGLDARVAGLQALGIEPFLTFESDARWATTPETRLVKNALPRDPADWDRFVRAVVARYDADGRDDMPGLVGPVRHWQAANEWISDRNRSGGWIGSADALVDYIRTAYDAVKSEDPEAVFVLGGVAAFNADVLLVTLGGQEMIVAQTWGEDSETVLTVEDMRGPVIGRIIDERVLPVLRRSPYDVASVHLYGPESRDIDRIRLMQDLTDGPVLSSECGGPSLDYGGRYTPAGHFRAVVERNLSALAAGAPFCLWFLLGEDLTGSTYGNRRTALYVDPERPKPGVFAYRMLSRLLDPDADVVRVRENLFALRRGDGRKIWIGWTDGADAVRRRAAEAGAQSFCLRDPSVGNLDSDPDRCSRTALVLGGRDLDALLAP